MSIIMVSMCALVFEANPAPHFAKEGAAQSPATPATAASTEHKDDTRFRKVGNSQARGSTQSHSQANLFLPLACFRTAN